MIDDASADLLRAANLAAALLLYHERTGRTAVRAGKTYAGRWTSSEYSVIQIQRAADREGSQPHC